MKGYGGTGGGPGSDTTALHVSTSAEIQGIAAKAIPVVADLIVIEDSAATWDKASATLASIPIVGNTHAGIARGGLLVRGVAAMVALAITANVGWVLTSDGTDAAWAAAAGGLTDITETTAASYVALTVDTAGYAFRLHSNGTGQVVVGSTTNTATVGAYCGVFAGSNNAASGVDAVIAGGTGGTASGGQSFLGGGDGNTASGTDSACVGGDGNTASGGVSIVLGGLANTAGASNSAIVGAQSANITSGCGYSVVAGGLRNDIDGNSQKAGIWGGSDGDIDNTASFSGIIGGEHCYITATHAVVLGGYSAFADHPTMAVISGNTTASDAERGKSQGQFVHLDKRTTADPGAVIYLASAGTEYAVPTDGSIAATGTIVIIDETAASGARTSAYKYEVVAENLAGTTSIRHQAVTLLGTDEYGGGGVLTPPAFSVSGADLKLGYDPNSANATRASAVHTMSRVVET